MPPKGGHAQSGRRPAIILQTDKASARVPTVLIAPLTSQLDALRFPGTVLIEPDSQTGLRRRSVALVFQLTAVEARHPTNSLSSVSSVALRGLSVAHDRNPSRQCAPS